LDYEEIGREVRNYADEKLDETDTRLLNGIFKKPKSIKNRVMELYDQEAMMHDV